MSFHSHTLPNGLEIIGETNPSALSVAVAFWVKTGARDEQPQESGVSHFLEHMVFKGTERRDSFAVNRDFSKIGADNNAWTSEENTVFHAAVLPEYLAQVVDVLADILRPSLRKEDFDTEKTVILDEIVRYEVQPGWSTYDQGRKLFYGNHPLGNSVLGSTQSITNLQRDQMQNYFDRRYNASNIFVVASGNFEFPKLVDLVSQSCSHWPTGKVERTSRIEHQGQGGMHLIPKPADKASQQYVLMLAPSPAAESPLRFAARVLSTIVGDYTGSRMFWALTDPGLADEAGMGADECDAAGAYYISFNCQPDNADEAYSILNNLLADVQKNGVTQEELQAAKTKILSREVRAAERAHRRMLSLAKDWAYLKRYRSVDDELASIDAVTVDSIRTVLDAYPLTNLTTITLGPRTELAGISR